MLISEVVQEPQPTRTLYHGTCRALIPSIMEYGLEPTVGPLVNQAYGDYEEEFGRELPELVFAADKENTIHACISAMGTAIENHYKIKRRDCYTYPVLARYGALCVIRSDNVAFQHHERDDDYFDRDSYPQVEPGDYFAENRIKPDYILTGKKLVWWLEKQRARFEPWKKRHNPTSGPWETAKVVPTDLGIAAE